MTLSGAITFTLATASLAAIAMAWRRHARIHIGEDFALARRRLPDFLVAASIAIQSTPLWFLLALIAASYAMGLAAIWIALANLLGVALNAWVAAPLLRTQAAATGSATLSQWFASSAGEGLQASTRRSAGAVVLFATGLSSFTLLQAAAPLLATLFGSNEDVAIAIAASCVLLIVVLGGIWSASVLDLAQTILTTLVLIAGLIATFVALGNAQHLDADVSAMTAVQAALSNSWFAGYAGVLAIALCVGSSFIAFGSAAQPAVIARYLACRDDAALARARVWVVVWSGAALSVALCCGWLARAALPGAANARELWSALTQSALSNDVSEILAILIAVVFVLACASTWIAAASHLATDLPRGLTTPSLPWYRAALAAFALLIGAAAIYFPVDLQVVEDRLWLSWHMLSATFGPLLLVRLTGKRVRPGSSLGAMWSGFVLTVLFHLMPDTPGDLLERCLPFVAAMGIALSGGERRRNPDRADRGDKTVHDHLPI